MMKAGPARALRFASLVPAGILRERVLPLQMRDFIFISAK
jgi:hypothetical protein